VIPLDTAGRSQAARPNRAAEFDLEALRGPIAPLEHSAPRASWASDGKTRCACANWLRDVVGPNELTRRARGTLDLFDADGTTSLPVEMRELVSRKIVHFSRPSCDLTRPGPARPVLQREHGTLPA